jgi:hypothetical protein
LKTVKNLRSLHIPKTIFGAILLRLFEKLTITNSSKRLLFESTYPTPTMAQHRCVSKNTAKQAVPVVFELASGKDQSVQL